MSTSSAKFKVGQLVRRYARELSNRFMREPYLITQVAFQNGVFRYTLQQNGDIPPLADFPEDLLKSQDAFNKFDVPYHVYELQLADGKVRYVDVGNEDDWGNLQDCTPGDCDDWMTSIGYGNDADGHIKILLVKDMEDGSTWSGNNAVTAWYNDCVARFVENYTE